MLLMSHHVFGVQYCIFDGLLHRCYKKMPRQTKEHTCKSILPLSSVGPIHKSNVVVIIIFRKFLVLRHPVWEQHVVSQLPHWFKLLDFAQ